MVLDEASQLRTALMISSDSATENYIPDITSPGWTAWHTEEFRQSGTYLVVMYTYKKAEQTTSRLLISVDTKRGEATVRASAWDNPREVLLKNNRSPLALTIAQITSLVEHQISLYKGMTIQDALANDRLMVAQMAADASHNPPVSAPTSGTQLVPPKLLSAPDLEFSEAARLNKIGGVVRVGFTIDETGTPCKLHLVKGLEKDFGLNEQALKAVSLYRFRPATLDGKPTQFAMTLDLNFEIF